MKRKKDGASLIIVIIIFMFISTVSIAMLSMIIGNYKARIAESKRAENLYASDSGLDVTYNVIGKTFDAATKYGYYEVQALKSQEGNPKSPNDETYRAIEEDVKELNKDIYNLQHENDSKQDKDKRKQSDIDKDIVKKRDLIEEDKQVEEILLNEEFKRAFKNFIMRTSNVKDEENIPEKLLQDSIEGHKYVSSITDNDINNINALVDAEKIIKFGIQSENNESPAPKLSVNTIDLKNLSEGSNETKGISKLDGHHEDKSFQICGQQYYDIAVTSDFYSKKDVNGIEYDSTKSSEKPSNERKLQAKYKMSVPNYKDIYSQNSTGDLKDYLALKDRALTIGGDMNITNADNLNVNGNIFVEGKEPTIKLDNSDRTYEKYHGGITIFNSKLVNFSKDVITRNTFNIQDEVNATIHGNLYGRNLYVGNISDGDHGFAKNSTLDLSDGTGQVVLDNDLSLKANNSTVNMKDFYGINDKNITYKDLEGKGFTSDEQNANKVKSSSSIIINGNDDKTSVNISDSVYIMGTAHIDTDKDKQNSGYQTGESGAVKKNYIAYSVPLNELEKFKYYNPLQLLDESNVFNKAKHFADYWSGKDVESGGIKWPGYKRGNFDKDKIHSVGAIVYKEDKKPARVIMPNYEQSLEENNGDENNVYNKRVEFAKKVYEFGQCATIDDYTNTRLTTFNSLMNLDKLPNEYVLKDQVNKGEYAIFNKKDEIKDKTKKIIINQYDGDKDEINDEGDDTIEINVAKKDGKYSLNAVIATDGDVSIESGITFNGSIIAKGDLNINKDSVNVNYDSDVIDRVQAKNIDTFKAVFGESIIDSAINSNNTNTESANCNYDLNNFLENKLWKIIK